ncbi:dTDP-4-dehydrorhamnose 3,5-epimerase [Pilimelia anulata]|uniref:dTDP-4-dehydrorhamnose 3,5-epimerase n=1 Tax=Pilimelia anulata TaxID=53371 RepID=A0A8J3F9C7_9ACTN|nr:dTDP-4-dehydrorhamnose 3,5-epimerase family protein [Pilimelia anulata]GGJ96597.1 dTDP-4-dehydrorhamnose 3,5-epimerase [Pilimelia anulata]
MRARALPVAGAFAFTPDVFPDRRGHFASPYQEPGYAAAVGHPLFPVAQASVSRSRRGVVRGLHFTAAPPGLAQYAYCVRGRARYVGVDLRVGSPTFGRWAAVALDGEGHAAVYFPTGFGHAFVALSDDTVMAYLLSGSYDARHEHALSAFDPALGLPVPAAAGPVLSDRDRVAPTLAQARERGLLPAYDDCLELDAARRRG